MKRLWNFMRQTNPYKNLPQIQWNSREHDYFSQENCVEE